MYDEFLSNQVYKINSEIRKLNNEINSYSPEFSSDLCCSSYYKKGDNRTTARRKYYNFELYADGVHPKQNFSLCMVEENISPGYERLLENTTHSTKNQITSIRTNKNPTITQASQ